MIFLKVHLMQYAVAQAAVKHLGWVGGIHVLIVIRTQRASKYFYLLCISNHTTDRVNCFSHPLLKMSSLGTVNTFH